MDESGEDLYPFPIQDKYNLVANSLKIRDLNALMLQMQLELRGLSEKWIDEFLSGFDSDAPQVQMRDNTDSRIVVDVDDSGKLFSSVECFICRKNIRVGFKKNRTQHGVKCNFIRGNFDRHYNVHHKD